MSCGGAVVALLGGFVLRDCLGLVGLFDLGILAGLLGCWWVWRACVWVWLVWDFLLVINLG